MPIVKIPILLPMQPVPDLQRQLLLTLLPVSSDT